MRLVTKNDKSYYVYGIKDSGFYLKDVSLPQKYRFGNICFDGHGMSADEQKHYLYDHVFKALNSSSGYEDFKKNLAEESIRVTEHVNGKGAYGISFYMENVEDPHIFKGAELSRQLTYRNIQRHFDGVAIGFSSHIDRVGEFRERVDREAFYMQGGGVMAIPELDSTGSGKKSQEDDLIPSKKETETQEWSRFLIMMNTNLAILLYELSDRFTGVSIPLNRDFKLNMRMVAEDMSFTHRRKDALSCIQLHGFSNLAQLGGFCPLLDMQQMKERDVSFLFPYVASGEKLLSYLFDEESETTLKTKHVSGWQGYLMMDIHKPDKRYGTCSVSSGNRKPVWSLTMTGYVSLLLREKRKAHPSLLESFSLYCHR